MRPNAFIPTAFRRAGNYALLLCLLLTSFATTAEARKHPDRIRVRFETTKGKFTVELFNETPLHRDNFLRLVREGYYDGLLFHRVIADFMAQTGDSTSRHAKPGEALGEGDVGYTIPAEIRTPEIFHRRGMLAAAREGDDVNPERRSSGAQIYFVWGKRFDEDALRKMRERCDKYLSAPLEVTREMQKAYKSRGGTPHLDGQYTVFGRIVSGLGVIDRIQCTETDAADRPTDDIRILRAYVLEK